MSALPKLICKYIVCFIIIICSTSYKSIAQQAFQGVVTDTMNKSSMQNAVVYLRSTKDSSLVKYTRANQKGNFTLTGVGTGKYIMVVSYPNYVDWIDTVQVTAETSLNINVFLTTKAHLLQEVIVKQTISPIRIKGDTTEYLADSFHVKAGATVEDLLKIMPGISVNSKGEITTQGQKVQKVLVDGDEFFGDDPTMATQNLNAKDVAKVQVFDRKSDQSTLTGIDDGTKQKTVNLILKEDAKKGYFGRVEGGNDLNKYYQGKVTASRFTSTLKTGFLTTADRTGKGGLNWDEMQDFSNSITTTITDGGVNMNWNNDEFDTYGQQGIPESLQSSFMLNKKFGALKSNTANNFTYNHLNTAGSGSTITKYILPDTVYYNNQYNTSNNSKWRQAYSTKNEFNIDSLTTITVNANGSFGKSNNYTNTNGEYLTGAGVYVNKSLRTNTSAANNNAQKADIFLKRKLNKAGTRSFTVSTGMTASNISSDGFLYNETDFYTAGINTSKQVVDQRKQTSNQSYTNQALASYIEPLSKRMSLNINYTFNSNNSEQDTRSYDKQNGKYDSLNLLYSNHYKFINLSHRGGFGWTYNTKKITIRTGIAVQDLAMKQTNIIKDSAYTRNFTNFFPNANIRWKFTPSGSIYLNYNGSTQQPSLMQIQPILNNTDPLNIMLGNPGLRPAFNHNFNLNIGDYKDLSGKEIGIYANATLVENAFSSKSVVDANGVRTTQTVNVNGNYNFYISADYGRKLKLFNLQASFSPSINGSRYTSFVNGIENITRSYTITPSIQIRRYVEKKGSIYLSYNAGYSHSESSINPGAVTAYWTHSIYLYSDYRLKNGWVINNNINANYRQKLSASDKNNNAFIWDLSLEKKIAKKKDITAILSVNDLLNQRIGFNRNISSNYITETTYTTVQRYAMISLRWKFNKNRKSSDDE